MSLKTPMRLPLLYYSNIIINTNTQYSEIALIVLKFSLAWSYVYVKDRSLFKCIY